MHGPVSQGDQMTVETIVKCNGYIHSDQYTILFYLLQQPYYNKHTSDLPEANPTYIS